MGAKNTHQLIPHCHPVSIDALDIAFDYLEPGHEPEDVPENLKGHHGVLIYAEGKSLGKTGIEMEVLTSVSVTALTVYDLLKPLDEPMEITSISLLEKKGGKSDRKRYPKWLLKAAVLVCSDSVYHQKKEDRSGLKIKAMLEDAGVAVLDYQIVADEPTQIREKLSAWAEQEVPFIFTTGGTGMGPRDVTAETVKSMLDKEAPGIVEAMRKHGNDRSPLAKMSNGIAGVINKSFIVTLPGSTGGVTESLDGLLPELFHAGTMIRGGGH